VLRKERRVNVVLDSKDVEFGVGLPRRFRVVQHTNTDARNTETIFRLDGESKFGLIRMIALAERGYRLVACSGHKRSESNAHRRIAMLQR